MLMATEVLAQTAPDSAEATQSVPTASPDAVEKPAESAPSSSNTQDETARLRKRLTELETKKSDTAGAEAQTQRLMSAGFTGGYALGVSTDVPWRASNRQLNVDAVSMPYFMALPLYFGQPKALRDYCASAWVGGDEYTATEAAMVVARRAAELLVKSVKVALEAGIGDEQIHRELLWKISASDAALITAQLRRAASTPDFSDVRALEAAATAQLAMWEWNPSLKGKCGLKQLGIWVGVPLEFDATVRVDRIRMKAKVSPVFAVGLGYSPNSYFSFLVGPAFSTLEVDGRSRAVTTLVFAVGGNLDIIGALAR
jgi:hypothetical protein